MVQTHEGEDEESYHPRQPAEPRDHVHEGWVPTLDYLDGFVELEDDRAEGRLRVESRFLTVLDVLEGESEIFACLPEHEAIVCLCDDLLQG